MKKRNLRTYAISTYLVLGLLLTGCGKTNSSNASTDTVEASATEVEAETSEDVPFDTSSGVSDEDATSSIVTDGIQSAVINSHNIEEVSGSEYGDQYIAKDTVNATYVAGDLTGILPQTVSKDYEFYFNKDTSAWEILSDTTTACEVNNDALPGSSWKCVSLDAASLSTLFGDDVSSDDTGDVYLHFLKRVGPFAFNLSNENNTSSERFFTTVGTNGTLSFVSEKVVVEKNFSIANGSVTDSGNVSMEVKVDTLPTFDVTTTSIENDEWKLAIGLKEENLSPALTWDAVDGATKYAIIMIDDTTASNWLHWYTIVDKTELAEGEFTDTSEGYAGPYPPETHEYDVYIVALAEDPGDVYFQVDATGGDISERMSLLNTKLDGSFGNVLAYGLVESNYTPGSDYYGDR